MNTNNKGQLTDSQIVKRSVASLKSIYRQKLVKSLPIGKIQIVASQEDILNWHSISAINARKLARRVMKKLRKPFKKNMNRHAMHRKASGKNEITRR